MIKKQHDIWVLWLTNLISANNSIPGKLPSCSTPVSDKRLSLGLNKGWNKL